MWVWSLGQEDPLEESMATHSSIFAWESHRQRSLAGCIAHRVAKGQTWLKQLSMHACSLADPPCSRGTRSYRMPYSTSVPHWVCQGRDSISGTNALFLMLCKQNNYPVSHFKTYPLIVLPPVIKRPGSPPKKVTEAKWHLWNQHHRRKKTYI